MTDLEKVFEDIKKQYQLCGTISEYINIIDSYLAPVKVLKKSGELNESTFAAHKINDLADPIVS